MSIQEIFSNFKRDKQGSDSVIALLIIVVGIASFLLGRMSVSQEVTLESPNFHIGSATQARELDITYVTTLEASPASESATGTRSDLTSGGYVASKNGTKYHLPWCAGAQRIKDENKVWFKSKEDAERAGYTPASNCKGI